MGNTEEEINRLLKKIRKGPETLRENVFTQIDKLINWTKQHRKICIASLAICLTSLGMAGVMVENYTSYQYFYHGTLLGTVKEKAQVGDILDLVNDELSGEKNVELLLEVNKDITFERRIGEMPALDDKDRVAEKLVHYGGVKAKGCIIAVNGKREVLTESEETALDILRAIKSNYMNAGEGSIYEKVGFAENVSLINVIANLSDLKSYEETYAYLSGEAPISISQQNLIQPVNHTEPESSFVITAFAQDLQIPEVTEEDWATEENWDQEENLSQEEDPQEVREPVLNVVTTELTAYREDVDYDITYEATDAMYEGETEVKSYGFPGMCQVLARVYTLNGEEVSRNVVSKTVISEPVNQVVLVGTKEKPFNMPSGFFTNPARGSLSSGFGQRWGRLHSGIDIAAPEGTSIAAADGGTVTFSGYNNGGYGNLVIVDHGNGKQTYYAHCSKLLVSVGDPVGQGQEIALVGSTGRSTGNHLHFEVRVDGVAQNPLQYVSY